MTNDTRSPPTSTVTVSSHHLVRRAGVGKAVVMVRWRGRSGLRVGCPHWCLLHGFELAFLEVGHSGNGQVEVVWARAFYSGARAVGRGERRV